MSQDTTSRHIVKRVHTGAGRFPGGLRPFRFALEQLHFLYIARCYTRVRLAPVVSAADTAT